MIGQTTFDLDDFGSSLRVGADSQFGVNVNDPNDLDSHETRISPHMHLHRS